ncbi:alpha/beta fold hydrolase [Chitinophaga pinensis]|uniref:Alpha/beta fold hydrolase n=1 Tax=Chitinophaga pinensis TaxID=79329 RepID=A0A5C6LLC8_9BACT|nr:alpha/beta fold hydrolase [Chitinophaga pinensis]TWV95123.1 alpha/beta fold hydrolase [Chitinophaga pinensis]
MDNRKIKLAFIGVVLTLFIFMDGFAQSAKPQTPVYVLVHGAWHGGWCWQKVSNILRANGAIVYTPTLSGLGEHKNTLDSTVNLDTHISDIVNLIEMEDLHDVILVGHSYGGTVIGGVADRIPERLRKLVFLDAILLENGQSSLSIQPPAVQKAMQQAAAHDGGLTIPAWAATAFGVKDSADARWVNARLTSHPFRTFSQPITLQHPYGNHLPKIFISCTVDMLPTIVPFAEKTKKSKEWTYYELVTGHDAMITEPQQTAALLTSFAR